MNNRESTLGVFIDIEGAFDKTTFPKIADSLTARNVPRVISGWIHNMLSKRAIKITVDDVTVRGMVVRGCPQGGVFGCYHLYLYFGTWSLIAYSTASTVTTSTPSPMRMT